MKRSILPCLLCVIFLLFSQTVGVVFAFQPEEIKFIYNNKLFTYSISSNIKHSNQFDLNYEINKYNRFGYKTERINCLFCFCPLYKMECGGNFELILGKDGKEIKDCSNCIVPHSEKGYEYVIEKLKTAQTETKG